MNVDKQDAFVRFVNQYRHVLRCVASFAHKPWTDDPVLNAYDLRPYQEPNDVTVMLALREIGAHKPEGMNTAIFVLNNIVVLKDLVRANSEDEARGLVVAFATYRKLNDGRVTKWRLHRH